MEDVKILNPGQRLRMLRKTLGVRQDELSGKKFSKNYISMFENNKRAINAVNATYLASKINEIARKKGKDIQITTSYLLKSETDIAKDKCDRWLFEVESNLELTDYEINSNLYKTILVASEHGLIEYKGRALFLKGISSFNNKRYVCAVTQFLDSLIYFARENNYLAIKDIYKNIGIALLKQRQLGQALIYFNMCDSVIEVNLGKDTDKDMEVTYYKALCYYNLGQIQIAKKLIDKCDNIDSKIIELSKQIEEELCV